MDITIGTSPPDALLDESLTDFVQFLWNTTSTWPRRIDAKKKELIEKLIKTLIKKLIKR